MSPKINYILTKPISIYLIDVRYTYM